MKLLKICQVRRKRENSKGAKKSKITPRVAGNQPDVGKPIYEGDEFKVHPRFKLRNKGDIKNLLSDRHNLELQRG